MHGETVKFTWFGLLVICHVLWSSVHMSYCSASSRTPSALNTWRPVPVQHATYWFRTELISSTKKSQVCKQVAVFRVDAPLNRSLECASGCRHWRERVQKKPYVMQPLTPRNPQIARKFPSIDLLNSVGAQTAGCTAPLGRDGQFKGPLMDPKPLAFLYLDEDTFNCVISTITSQTQCFIIVGRALITCSVHLMLTAFCRLL
jgi:hypothetical protein